MLAEDGASFRLSIMEFPTVIWMPCLLGLVDFLSKMLNFAGIMGLNPPEPDKMPAVWWYVARLISTCSALILAVMMQIAWVSSSTFY